MTDVLLTHSFFLHFDPKQESAHMPYPPLGTLYAASFLQSAHITVKLFDTMLAASEDELRESIRAVQPRLLVIYDDDFNYLNKMCLSRMREAAFAMTAIAAEFSIPVIVHGSDAADHAEKYLLHGAKAVVIGEGERTLLEVCTVLLNHRTDLGSVKGLAFLDRGTFTRTAERPVMQTLDGLPFPAWELVEWSAYRTIWKKHHGFFSVNMVTTRGCPYHCNWCAKPIYGQIYNSRSPENVVEEIVQLRSLIQPDHIWFADDIFGLKPGWVKRFSELMNEQEISIPFKIQSRADLLAREHEVRALASAGCSEVWIGAESGSQKILDAMEKGITRRQITDARNSLKEHRIETSFFLQFGYLGETKEDIDNTISMVKELMPDNIGISISYPLPGTKFYDTVFSHMGEKKNWTDSDDLAMLYQGTFSSAYYKRLHRYVHRIFRIRQAFLFLEEILLFRHIPTKKYLRRIASLAWHIPSSIIDSVTLTRLSKNHHRAVFDNTAAVDKAFSAQAPTFDDDDKRNPILQWIRSEVYGSMNKYLRPGDTILDINAGTGIDAVHFARLGHDVTAVDLAEGMISVMEKKVKALGLSERISVRRSSYTDLQSIQPTKFHHVMSNFGGLNCISYLKPVAEQLKHMLHPNGIVTLVIMPPVCPWEILHVLRGKFSFAFRRLKRNGTIAQIEGITFLTHYHSPAETITCFGNDFTVLKVQGLASFSPPPFMERFSVRHPGLYKLLTGLDKMFSTYPPFNRWADHYILTLRYTPEQ